MTTASSSNDSLDRLLLLVEGNDDGLDLADFDDAAMAPTSVTDMGMEMEAMDFVMEGMVKEDPTATAFSTGTTGVFCEGVDVDHHQGHHGDHDHLNLSHDNLDGVLLSMFQQQQPPPPSHFEQQQVARKVSLASETSNTFQAAFQAPPLFSQPPQQMQVTQQQAAVRNASPPKKRRKQHRRAQTEGCFTEGGCFDFLYQQKEQQPDPNRIVSDLIGAAGGADNSHFLSKTNPDRLKMMANSFVEQERQQIVAAAAPAAFASAGIRHTVSVQPPLPAAATVTPPSPAIPQVSLPEVAMTPAPPVPEIVVLDSNDEEKAGGMNTEGGEEPSRLSKFLDTLQAQVDQDNAKLRQQMGITEEEAWMSMIQEQNNLGSMEQQQHHQPPPPSRQGKRRNHHRRVVSEGGAHAHHFAAGATPYGMASNGPQNNSGSMPFTGVLDFDMADRKEDAALFASTFMT